MLRLDVRPDHLTLPFVLKSAMSLVEFRLGATLHAGIARLGLEFDSFVRISLIDMYVKVGSLDRALQLFDETPMRTRATNMLLWNILINGCCRARDVERAVELFEAMPERTTVSWNSLINGLMRIGDIDGAWVLFDRLPEKNVVSWTTMVAGFFQNGDHKRALDTFYRMLDVGVKPNDFTVVSALSTCSRIGALHAGVWIHEYILGNGSRINRQIGTALVEMYAKCGEIERASRVFCDLKEKDLLTWSVMISGWGIHGRCEHALHCFEEMKSTGMNTLFFAYMSAKPCLSSK